MGSYILYHCHSDYSLLDSCSKYSEYIELAVRDGMRALSISEHGKPMNWTEKWSACKKAGIKYMHSVEIYLTETLSEKIRDNYHTVLIARNIDGVRELNKLVSKSCDEDHFYYTNRISFEEFLGMSDNIISTSACLASPLNKLSEEHPMYAALVKKYDFLEIQGHNHPDQIEFNKKLLRLSREYNKKLIAGTDTHSSSKYKAECRAALLSSKHKSYGDEDAFDLTYKTYDELVDMFRIQDAIPEEEYMSAIENTNLLFDMTEEITLDTTIKYPILYGSRDADDKKFTETIDRKFREKIEAGIIPDDQIPAFESAIKEELRVFRKLNMTGFMLSMSELISWCKDNNITVGTARGSVGGSRIAYVTDIIDLNPETWHTVFSRFCNEDREEIGDIDIDVIESDRPAIFNHIVSRFGEDKTARVASFGTMKDKAFIDDIGRHLSIKWEEAHKNSNSNNPWSLKDMARIKNEYESDPEKTKEKYKELFYYMDGMVGTKTSQSVHPAGMVISPITLDDNYGVFNKDGDMCMFLDMENVHDFTGLAKYDFLILKTLEVLRDTCRYIGESYPKTYEINWNDAAVWESMRRDTATVFQFEKPYASECLRKFNTNSIFDMAIVNACIRPSGDSYRDDLLARKPHKNPSDIIDNLLKDNLGYLIYQEDTIKFLQEICGLSGSAADNVRRAIGRKQRDRLEKALPGILEGYCSKSDKSREIAEKEAKEFLQVIEDSASYQFGYNHAIAYCLIGYLCAYYRYYHPLEYMTSFLNNAANDEDISNGTKYVGKIGAKVTMPKWGFSKGDYAYDIDKNVIAKGLSSIKYMGEKVAEGLYNVAHGKEYRSFMDVLLEIERTKCIDVRQLDILIKIDFFSEFGNQRELLMLADIFQNTFKSGSAKQIKKASVYGSPMESIIEKYSVGTTKSGGFAKSYTIVDINAILVEVEEYLKGKNMEDLSDIIKIQNFVDIMGYVGYISDNPEDRRKLYIMDVYPLSRRSDGKQFGYSIITKSIGSGKESRFTVFNRIFDKEPIRKGDIIYCNNFERDGQYFTLTGYSKIYA